MPDRIDIFYGKQELISYEGAPLDSVFIDIELEDWTFLFNEKLYIIFYPLIRTEFGEDRRIFLDKEPSRQKG